MKNLLIATLRLLTILCLLGVLALSVAGYLGTLHRRLELVSHFKLQYLAIAILCLPMLLALRAWRWAAVALLAVALNAAVVLPWFWAASSASVGEPDAPADVRLLLVNVNAANPDYAALLSLIEREKADLILVQEASDGWREALAALAGSHPFTRFVVNRDNAGIALYSRFPVEEMPSSADDYGFPVLLATVKIEEAAVTLISIHPPPPGAEEFLQQRNEQLARVATLASQAAQPVLVAGDLNISLWSPYYTRFAEQSGLRAARRGFGVLPTWPTHLPLLMLPLDHCLVSQEFAVMDCRTGSHIGSDHLPLLVDLRLSQAPEP